MTAGPQLPDTQGEGRTTCCEDFVEMQMAYEKVLRRVPLRHAAFGGVSSSCADGAGRATRMATRAVDLAAGCIGCIVMLLVLPVVGLAIRLDDGGPIFFRQRRVGLNGRSFRLLKFRTMVLDAERDGPRWAVVGDARVTRVGRFLRASHLDETPQFWNVLKGEMSLIGPRPERPEFVVDLERRIPSYRERFQVRPGLTGWAQVNYPYGASVSDAASKLQYDLYYIEHRGVLLDVLIVIMTVWTIFRFSGR